MWTKKHVCFFFILLLSVSLFSTLSMADIRSTSIKNQTRSFTLIDVFDFTENGRLELNVSHIDIPIPNPNTFNLSLIGFFLVPREMFLDISVPPFLKSPWSNRTKIKTECFLQPSIASEYSVNIIYTFDKLQGSSNRFNMVYSVTYPMELELFFQNCISEGLRVSMDVRSAMYNEDGRRSYISASKISVLEIHCIFILSYLILACLWFYAHWTKRSKVKLIMIGAILAKMASLLFEVFEGLYINETGNAGGWGVFLALLSGFFNDTSMTMVIVLAFSGWTMNNLFLIILVLLQTIRRMVNVVMVKRGPCGFDCSIRVLFYRFLAYNSVGFMINYPYVMAWKFFVTGGQRQGKAAVNLRKVKRIGSLHDALILYILLMAIIFQSL